MLFAHIHSHTLRISSFDYAKQRPFSTQHTRTGRGTHTLTHRHSSERLKAHKQTARRRSDVGSIGTCVWCVCKYVCMLACNSACVQVCVCVCVCVCLNFLALFLALTGSLTRAFRFLLPRFDFLIVVVIIIIIITY